jgi:hypothetical protein
LPALLPLPVADFRGLTFFATEYNPFHFSIACAATPRPPRPNGPNTNRQVYEHRRRLSRPILPSQPPQNQAAIRGRQPAYGGHDRRGASRHMAHTPREGFSYTFQYERPSLLSARPWPRGTIFPWIACPDPGQRTGQPGRPRKTGK